MLSANERQAIIDLIHREVAPAIGCTEPIAVALCTARATELLGELPEKIDVLLSANVLKNAMGVGIPGTGGMIGLPIAVALGAIVGKSEYNLEVLKESNDEAVERGRKYIAEERISVALKENISEKLYIEISCRAGENSSMAIISGGHTNFIYEEKNGQVLLNNSAGSSAESATEEVELNLRKVYDFAMTSPVEELTFILEAKELNKAAAEASLKGNYGHCLGKAFRGDGDNKTVMGNTVYSRIVSYTAAACDARMAGAMIPVMSNSGSGNQGITSTLPVVVYAEEVGANQEQTIRALILSHLTVIYIKQSLGRLSALCGCVVAATGSSCGIAYLMGGEYEHVTYAVKNMIANLTGMICDGAKPSCALKLASGVSMAVLSAMMAKAGQCVSSLEGIIDDDVDRSIRNLTRIGREGMNETDKLILSIMTSK